MSGKPLTPPSPPLSGGEPAGGELTATPYFGGENTWEAEGPDEIGRTPTPSPDKGRAGEGLGAAAKKNFLAYDKRLTAFARANRQQPTPAENLLWQKVLRDRQFHGYKFLRQKPIGPYIADFYCAELKLVIEIDGDSHACQGDYDAARTAFLEQYGVRVLRYANRDILNHLPGVYEHL